ncbi:RtcB family protein [Mycobacterium heckeshornense]|uniref:tRNA-splicing ligase RtcB n=1 Tax=Mycobacterium heckeshornense TaxID=110505 RepID=A0A2G8B2S5_9MYCO|nr:RtcB family protein [Mycobacterium heckeshornense]KMV21619.1 RNA ligase [Mycobacterium heckeshornense]MCV7034076.1 RtcB family protein [Mycobacterium heckeshornense]PIJ32061.1 RtcB family protein [Mycobacterium heckeshornense]BCO34787.1 RNA-splicing ligase RtcB [Mycobacterium heckeshornense]
MRLVQETPFRFRIDPSGDMRVPGVIFASPSLLPATNREPLLRQVANVATLPGIVEASYAMPDIHLGYGFPIGGVAATDVRGDGVISPGGVGFDISCGVRMLSADLDRGEFAKVGKLVMDRLSQRIPRGAGPGAVRAPVSDEELDRVLQGGSRYVVEHGDGCQLDLDRCEDGGGFEEADPAAVSDRARARGRQQLGSLGSGNHFLEVQHVAEVLDEPVAKAFGLRAGQVCVMIHCGSRGLGHQICTDEVHAMDHAMQRHGVHVPDRQLACVPVDSGEGRRYLGAMYAAANYARANRQILGRAASEVFSSVTGTGLELVYDISHNLARIERHEVAGEMVDLCVHRKGATRALPPGHPELPADLADVGQPVLIPGSMGTSSYVLAGVAGGGAFHSTCHGAGRQLSRHQAARSVSQKVLRDQLERRQGILVRGASRRGLVEEAPAAYKDVSEVVAVAEQAGLCRRVARLEPLGVVKG